MASLRITSERTTGNAGSDRTQAKTKGSSKTVATSTRKRDGTDTTTTDRTSDTIVGGKSHDTSKSNDTTTATDETRSVTNAHSVLSKNQGEQRSTVSHEDYGYDISFVLKFVEGIGNPEPKLPAPNLLPD